MTGSSSDRPANDALGELLRKFRSNLAKRLSKLESLLEDETGVEAAIRELHKLAGTSGSFGLELVSSTAHALELALRTGAHAGVVLANLEQLREAIDAETNAAPTKVLSVEATAGISSVGVLGGLELAEQVESLLADQIYATSARHIVAMHDAIIVDATDGDMKSSEIEAVRRAYAGQNVPILMIVGDTSLESSVSATHAGADLVLPLPLSKAGLVDALSSLVAERYSEQYTVLVVDDDADAVELICDKLLDGGLKARGIVDSNALFESLREVTPSAIVLDFDMPSFSGVELCATLRASRQYRFLPIVFLTNRRDRRARRRAYKVGCDDFLHKSSVGELAERLHARINRLQGLRAAAEVDALTGLALRRSFVPSLEACIATAEHRQTPLSVAMLDLDKFKAINDREGHVAGDLVLARWGACIDSRLRSGDLACRWGGEEVLLAFPLCEAEDARRTLEDIQAELFAIAFPGKEGSFVVCFSAGVAELHADAQTLDELIGKADQRLLLAKARGRNRIVGPSDSETLGCGACARVNESH